MLLLAALAAPVPALLVAVTVKVYEVFAVRPLTVMGEVALEPVMPPGEEVAVYEVMVAPPLSAGAVKATVAVVEEVAVAVPIVGASGVLAVTALVVLDVAAVDPYVFVAVTWQVIVCPT